MRIRRFPVRLRVLRNGLYLGAFAEFESLSRKYLDRSTVVEIYKAARPTLGGHFSDVDDLVRRLGELKTLRDELVHGGFYVRAQTESRLEPLLRRDEVRIAHGVIDFGDEFLPTALEEFRLAALTLMRGVGPLRDQLGA